MKKALPLLILTGLVSCNSVTNPLVSNEFYFDTMIQVKLYDGNKKDIDAISTILKRYDGLSDNYQNKINETSIYSLNQDNEEKVISSELYDLLQTSLSLKEETNGYFNPFVGSLVKKWKSALANKQILSQEEINIEIDKINNTSLKLEKSGETFKCQRIGEGEIDLGAISKGYVLDKVKGYLDEKQEKQYLINGGSSSLLLGSKNTKDGLFSIGLKDVKNAYVTLKDCFVGCSGTSEQGVKIEGTTYSHIINPFTGSAINKYDMTFVVANNGALSDVLSTCFMMMDTDQIKEMETTFGVYALAYKDNKIIYKNDNIEVKYH